MLPSGTPITAYTPQKRAAALLDGDQFTDLSLTAQHRRAPWLGAQGHAPQANDGVVILSGTRRGAPGLAIATDPHYFAGTIGDAGGTRVAAAITRLCDAAGPAAGLCHVLLWLDGGGVRVHEGTGALLGAQALLVALARARRTLRLTAIVTGVRGCYGAWALAAGLCHHRIIVRGARLGLSGPKVIERMGPALGLDAAAIDAMHGAQARLAARLVDACIDDDSVALQRALDDVHSRAPGSALGPTGRKQPHVDTWRPAPVIGTARAATAGLAWLEALSTEGAPERWGRSGAYRGLGTLVASPQGGSQPLRLLALGPSPNNKTGSLGISEARSFVSAMHAHVRAHPCAPLLLIIDSPGQTMDIDQERSGLQQHLADLLGVTEQLVASGCPVLAWVVGQAISGGFLCFGLGARAILAPGDGAVCIRPMGRAGAERLMHRTKPGGRALDALDEGARPFARLGGLDMLVPGAAGPPEGTALDHLRAALAATYARLSAGPSEGQALSSMRAFGTRLWSKEAWEAWPESITPAALGSSIRQ